MGDVQKFNCYNVNVVVLLLCPLLLLLLSAANHWQNAPSFNFNFNLSPTASEFPVPSLADLHDLPVPPIHLSKASFSLSSLSLSLSLSNPQVLCICQATLRPASSSKIKYMKKVQKKNVSQSTAVCS